MSAFCVARNRRRLVRLVAVAVTAGALTLPASALAADGWSGPTVDRQLESAPEHLVSDGDVLRRGRRRRFGQTFNGSAWGAPTNIDPSSNPSGHTLDLDLVSVGLVLRRSRPGRQRADVQRQYMERARGGRHHAEFALGRVVRLGLVLRRGRRRRQRVRL